MSDSVKNTLVRNLRRALYRKDLSEAEEILDRLRYENPASAETRGLELEILLAAGRIPEAGELSAQLVRLFPGSARIFYLAGQYAYRIREYDRAAEYFEESHRLHPHWRSSHWLARTLTQKGDFGRSEPLLLSLVREHPHCRADLAWLYERQKDWGRAREELAEYRRLYPNDKRAEAQELRLKARSMDAEEVIDEMETLADLGEEPPGELLPEYLRSLLTTGQGARARKEVKRLLPKLDRRLALGLGWVCYHHHTYDLACDLFLFAFEEGVSSPKFLNSLEKAAAVTGRIAELIDLYQEHAVRWNKLYGRIDKQKNKLS